MQILMSLQQRGWSGRIRDMSHVGFLVYFLNFVFVLLYFFARAEPAPVNRFWRSIRPTTCFRARKSLLGSRSYCTPFWGEIPPPPILGAWMGIFKLNAQTIKLIYYQNYCTGSNHILHNDKDHQILFVSGTNTRKISSKWRTGKYGMITTFAKWTLRLL